MQGGGPQRACPACRAWSPAGAERCRSCGSPLEDDSTFDERLVWALDHPDTATAMLAAELLARRGTSSAVPHLVRLVDSPDPYRAAAAALLRFEGHPLAREALARCRDHPSVLVRSAVASAADRTAARW